MARNAFATALPVRACLIQADLASSCDKKVVTRDTYLMLMEKQTLRCGVHTGVFAGTCTDTSVVPSLRSGSAKQVAVHSKAMVIPRQFSKLLQTSGQQIHFVVNEFGTSSLVAVDVSGVGFLSTASVPCVFSARDLFIVSVQRAERGCVGTMKRPEQPICMETECAIQSCCLLRCVMRMSSN